MVNKPVLGRRLGQRISKGPFSLRDSKMLIFIAQYSEPINWLVSKGEPYNVSFISPVFPPELASFPLLPPGQQSGKSTHSYTAEQHLEDMCWPPALDRCSGTVPLAPYFTRKCNNKCLWWLPVSSPTRLNPLPGIQHPSSAGLYLPCIHSKCVEA